MRVFISHIVPKEQAMTLKVSVAGHLFNWNLIESGAFDDFFSIVPPNIVGKIDFDCSWVVYSNWRKHRILCKFARFKEQFKLYKNIRQGTDVWFFNMTTLNAVLFSLLKWFRYDTKVYVIVSDFTPDIKKNKFCHLMRFLINKADGLITLSHSPLFTVSNSVCLPGVVPSDAPEYPKITRIDKSFLISGVLSDHISMLSTLLEAFAQSPGCTLHITGFLADTSVVDKYREYPNIVYHGQVSYTEYLQILHDTPFLLSTRDPAFPENQCNFPSKIIEGLLHNRIIVSTIHYPQLDGINYFETEPTLQGLVRTIRRISTLPESEVLPYANQAQIVKERFNAQVWNDTMTRIENNAKR